MVTITIHVKIPSEPIQITMRSRPVRLPRSRHLPWDHRIQRAISTNLADPCSRSTSPFSDGFPMLFPWFWWFNHHFPSSIRYRPRHRGTPRVSPMARAVADVGHSAAIGAANEGQEKPGVFLAREELVKSGECNWDQNSCHYHQISILEPGFNHW